MDTSCRRTGGVLRCQDSHVRELNSTQRPGIPIRSMCCLLVQPLEYFRRDGATARLGAQTRELLGAHALSTTVGPSDLARR